MDLKNKILTATWDLYSTYGVRSVSVDDIAKKSGISKNSIYQEFGGKDNLTKEIVEIRLNDNKQAIEEYISKDSNAINVMFEFAEFTISLFKGSKPQFLYDLEKYHTEIWNFFQQKQYEITSNNVIQNLKQGIEEGLYLEDLDLDFTSRLFINMNIIATGEKFFPSDYDKGELYYSMIIYHLRSITTPKGREYLQNVQLTKIENQHG